MDSSEVESILILTKKIICVDKNKNGAVFRNRKYARKMENGENDECDATCAASHGYLVVSDGCSS